MTTEIKPTNSLEIPFTCTLVSPFHHGAGSQGNTSILRTQDVAQPDGTTARLPFLSAASVRHALRDRIAWHLIGTLNAKPPEHTWSKPAVDLLWSGGAVSKTGAETDLQTARDVETLFPALSLFGYAAQSDIIAGTLRASDLILVCEENDWRLPDDLHGAKRAANWRSEEFGTRHDVATSPVSQLIETAETLLGDSVKTTQMIFDTQILIAGSRLHGSLGLQPGATEAQRMVLGAALALWAPNGIVSLGAKTAQGYGIARIEGLPDTSADLEAWTAHVKAHGDEIIDLIGKLTK